MVLSKEDKNNISSFEKLLSLIDKSNVKTKPSRVLEYDSGRLKLITNGRCVIDSPLNEFNWKDELDSVCDMMLTSEEKRIVYPELFDEQGRMWI